MVFSWLTDRETSPTPRAFLIQAEYSRDQLRARNMAVSILGKPEIRIPHCVSLINPLDLRLFPGT
jgi:hypothetical protein